MTSELAKLRQHYDTLPPHVKERTTAQSLLRAIQIAEQHEAQLREIRDMLLDKDDPARKRH